MSSSRDLDRLMTAFMEDGPAVMTDRVLEAIRDDVDRIDQRATLGPWRNLPMFRPILATAAVVAAIAAGLAVYSIVSPNVGIDPAPEPTPAPSSVSFPADGPLEVGTTYAVSLLSESLTLTIPDSMSESEVVGGQGDPQSFRVDTLDYGVVTFHDDQRVPNDLCQPTETIRNPQTPDEVAAWLAGSNGVTVSEPTELTVDGRTAFAFDVAVGPSCYVGGEPPVADSAFWFQANEHHRVYAIPTAEDTLLAVTWGGGFAGEGEEFLDTMNAATDDLVRSMTFE